MASFTKESPILQGEEFYTEWMQDLQIWMLLTYLTKEKWGLAVFLLSSWNILMLDICWWDIGKAEGLKLIMDKLDENYLQHPNTNAYMAFKEL